MKNKKIFKRVFTIVFIVLFVFGTIPISALELNGAELIPAKIVSEIAEMREESVKYFLCDDGSYISATYSSPVHYEEDGEWKEIDNSLTLSNASSEAFYTTEGGLNVTIPKILAEGKYITATNKGHTIGFALKGDEIALSTQASVVSADKLPSVTAVDTSLELTAQAESLSASAMTEAQKIEKHNEEQMTIENQTGALVYKNFRNNSDLEYVVTSNSIKENIVVYSTQSDYIYRFNLDSDGLVPVESSNGCICLVEPSKPDEVVFILSTPYMYDSNGNESYDITTSIEPAADGYTLTVEADKNWINASGRAFPVVIDPTWTAPNSHFSDAFVIDGINSDKVRLNKELRVGQNLANLTRTYIKMTMPTNLPAGSTITGATLSLRKQNYFKSLGQDDVDVRVYDCKDVAEWSITNICWNQQPFSNSENGYLNSGATLLTSVSGSKSKSTYTFNITSAVQSWYETGVNKGIMLASSDESEKTQIDFYSSRTSTISYRPVFKITYTKPSVSSSTYTFEANESESSVINVVSSKAWTTEVTSGASWLSVTDVTDSGFKLKALANPNVAERMGAVQVNIGGSLIGTINVTQYGSAATVVLDRDRWDINETGEQSKTVAVTSNASWTVSSDSSWITLDKTGGNGDSSFTISVASNSELTTTRMGTVTVTAGEVVKTIEVTQFDEVSGYFNPVDSDGVSETRSSSEYNHRLAAWAMDLAYAAYMPLTGGLAISILGSLMESYVVPATSLLTEKGFTYHSYNSGEHDTVAHTIAHRNIFVDNRITVSDSDINSLNGGTVYDGLYQRSTQLYNGIYGFFPDILSASSLVNDREYLLTSRNNYQLVVIDIRGSETLED